MRPLAVLLGIITGSTVSVFIGLLLTAVVLLFLPEHADRFAAERPPLLRATALFGVAALVASAGFYSELRLRPWRLAVHAVTLMMLCIIGWAYWPKP